MSAEQVAYQFTVARATHELLLRAQELLGAEVAPGDLATVFTLALKSLVKDREKARHGLHTESRGTSAVPARGRYIPAQLKAQVYQRDLGQCAFMTDDGLRCECRADLEYDHIVPIAQGGRTTADNLRLLCPAHNQYEADRKLGRDFMEQKRRDAVTCFASEATRDVRTTMQGSGGVGHTPERGESEATGSPRGVRSAPPRHEQVSANAIVEPGTTRQEVSATRDRRTGHSVEENLSSSRAGRTRSGTHP
ncbi:MAG: HNH endonuclease [Candidatus Eisenbacteria bacterium]|nr:HNH endonuclease [Candidatus Eisenbacteria bacterium]